MYVCMIRIKFWPQIYVRRRKDIILNEVWIVKLCYIKIKDNIECDGFS